MIKITRWKKSKKQPKHGGPEKGRWVTDKEVNYAVAIDVDSFSGWGIDTEKFEMTFIDTYMESIKIQFGGQRMMKAFLMDALQQLVWKDENAPTRDYMEKRTHCKPEACPLNQRR